MKIAVVGAGMAGLAAARALQDRHDVRVFERAPIPGGRCATRVITAIELPRGLSGELAFDHGAQYFTVRDQRFSEIAAEWERDRIIAKWTGRIVSFDGEGWEDVEEGTRRYVGTPGMIAIPAALARGLTIEYGTKIESLNDLAEFDRVILAIPAPEATLLRGRDYYSAHRNDHETNRVGSTQFSPTPIRNGHSTTQENTNNSPDPLKSMKPCWAVMAAFEERVAARFDAAFINGSALSWVARNTSKPKRNYKIDAWVLQASTSWSEAHFNDRPDDVGAFLMEAFDDLIPSGLPKAFFATVHRWKHATADPPLAVGAIGDPSSRVICCGDWCRGSRIEDAYLSGLMAADLMA
jgi:renalase